MSQFNNYYKGKTVLVTGHTGFKGSWLSIWLLSLGAKVVGVALEPFTEKDNFVLSGLEDKLVDIRADIRDADKMKEIFNEYHPDIVFHLAAQPLVRLSYELPRETFEQNVMGTVNILEAFRAVESVKVCICITTDKVYRNNEWIWGYKETDPYGGYDPYSASKGACEIVIDSYINSFFNPEEFDKHGKVVASVRAGNVIGGGDWAKDRIVPDIIRAIEADDTIILRMPEATRPWQHVLEPLSGYLELGSKALSDPQQFSGGWNFGPNPESIITVLNITEMIISNFQSGTRLEYEEAELHEAKLLGLDCTKARALLEWIPALNIQETIDLTTDWYKNYSVCESVYGLCIDEIERYVGFAKEKELRWASE